MTEASSTTISVATEITVSASQRRGSRAGTPLFKVPVSVVMTGQSS
ncbi:hypothetical protein [Streptomyces sp. NBC_01320]|nr:hypothetical protein OG395_06185 [Streptomyces sp. NBC_01320]